MQSLLDIFEEPHDDTQEQRFAMLFKLFQHTLNFNSGTRDVVIFV